MLYLYLRSRYGTYHSSTLGKNVSFYLMHNLIHKDFMRQRVSVPISKGTYLYIIVYDKNIKVQR